MLTLIALLIFAYICSHPEATQLSGCNKLYTTRKIVVTCDSADALVADKKAFFTPIIATA